MEAFGTTVGGYLPTISAGAQLGDLNQQTEVPKRPTDRPEQAQWKRLARQLVEGDLTLYIYISIHCLAPCAGVETHRWVRLHISYCGPGIRKFSHQ